MNNDTTKPITKQIMPIRQNKNKARKLNEVDISEPLRQWKKMIAILLDGGGLEF
jgi:hypothetical protein